MGQLEAAGAPAGAAPVTIPTERLRPLLEQGRSAGVDPSALLRDVGAPCALSAARDGGVALAPGRISLADYFRIQNRLSALIGDETCRLSERQLLPGSTDFVLRTVGACETLAEGLRTIAQSYNLLHGGSFNRVEAYRGGLSYTIDDREFPYTVEENDEYVFFSIEAVQIFLHCMVMTVAPTLGPDAVRAVYVRRPYRGADCGYLDYWRAPVRYGAPVYRVVFDATAAGRPVSRPPARRLTLDAVYETAAEAMARLGEGDRPVRFADEVRRLIASGAAGQGEVAHALGVSVATLRRRLCEENASFRDLRREALNASAKALLRERRSVDDVAAALGFSEFRSFARAFKHWNGVTPTVYARQTQARRARR